MRVNSALRRAPRQWLKLTLRRMTIAMVVFVLAASTLVVGSALYLASITQKAEIAWTGFREQQDKRVRLLDDLQASLGYGGMIESFANYILRRNDDDLDQAIEFAGAARVLVKQYAAFGQTPREREALNDIRQALDQYFDAFRLSREMANKGASASEISDSLLLPSANALALRGIRRLSESLAESMPEKPRPSRALYASRIRQSLGFGGMIHAFKGYILNSRADTRDSAMKYADDVDKWIAAYRKLGIDAEEARALDDIAKTVAGYRAALVVIGNEIDRGATPEEIDAGVRVSDRPAFRALRVIDQHVARNGEADANEVNHAMRVISRSVRAVAIEQAVVGVSLAALLIWILFYAILKPVAHLSQVMTRIAGGEYDTLIGSKGRWAEIRGMSRAIKILRANSIKRREAEGRLEEANRFLNIQLENLQESREKIEMQASETIAMAEELIFLRDDAEAARIEAQAGQDRILSIFNAVSDVIFTVTEGGDIESCNAAAERMFGLTPDNIAGLNISFLFAVGPGGMNGEWPWLGEGKNLRAGMMMVQKIYNAAGEERTAELTVTPVTLGHRTSYTVVLRDVTERQRQEAEIRRLAMTDQLTGLANRHQFNTKLREAVLLAQRGQCDIALMLLDLDRFKAVNDTYGHPAGDALLRVVADRLSGLFRETDTIARLGGDEFAIILVGARTEQDVEKPASRVLKVLAIPVNVDDLTFSIGTSIGIAFWEEGMDGEADLVRQADIALYAAKDAGRNCYRLAERGAAEA